MGASYNTRSFSITSAAVLFQGGGNNWTHTVLEVCPFLGWQSLEYFQVVGLLIDLFFVIKQCCEGSLGRFEGRDCDQPQLQR